MKYSQLALKMKVIAHDLRGHLGHFDSKFFEIRLVCTIVFNGFQLDSPNLHQICILGFSLLAMKMNVIDLDLQGRLAISPQNSNNSCHSMSLLYTDLGRPRGVTRPTRALVVIYFPEHLAQTLTTDLRNYCF